MKDNSKGEKNGEVRGELKYCEHCGGLWVRERGAGVVYCDQCQPKVADLPIPKKRSRRIMLPVGPRAKVEDYAVEIEDDTLDFEAAGGVA
jgi:hypothetical protein